MNICKERINNRTKSLRKKFSRNRSYSELSFKDVTSPSSTSTAAAGGGGGTTIAAISAATLTAPNTSSQSLRSPFHLLSKKTSTSSSVIIPQPPASAGPIIQYQQLQNESYGSAFDLNIGPGSPTIDPIGRIDTIGRPFSWQHDVAIQCDLIPAPQLFIGTSDVKKSTKKNLSSSISHSATTTLINVAAAKLRNITDHHSYGGGLNQSSTLMTTSEKTTGNGTTGGGGCVGRFWKSTMSVTFHPQNSGPSSPFTLSAAALNGKKSTFHWTASVRRRQRRTPILKRAASFNDNSGMGEYARLVQSTSSPSSPELIHSGDYLSTDIVGLSTTSQPKLIRPTALLSASAAMTATATAYPHLATVKSIKTETPSTSSINHRRNKQIFSAPDSFDDSTVDDDDDNDNDVDTDTNIVILVRIFIIIIIIKFNSI